MTRLADSAKLTLTGFKMETSVTLESPLTQQVTVMYQAMKHYADLHGWEKTKLRGHSGLAGTVSQRQIAMALFGKPGMTDAETENFKQGLRSISAVLKKTGAAVCIDRAYGGNPSTWFVRDTIPNSITQTVAELKFGNENSFLSGVEKKLSDKEAGELEQPGPVTVKKKKTKGRGGNNTDHLYVIHEQRRQAHAAFKQQIYDEISTNPVPLIANDVAHIMAKEDGRTRLASVRDCINELVEEGLLVERTETLAERHVRGGGRNVMARSAILLWPAPGPVPERTRLPDGIDPVGAPDLTRSAVRKRYESEDETVLDALAQATEPVSAASISDKTGLRHHLALAALRRLAKSGHVTRINNRSWELRTNKISKEEPPAAKETVKETAKAVAGSGFNSIDSANDAILEIMAAMQRHGFVPEPAKADTSELDALRAENVKLSGQVKALRMAISSLES